MRMVAGVDPGLTGAVALLDTADGRVVSVEDLPVMSKTWGKGQEVDGNALAALLRSIAPDLVLIERVRAMPPRPVGGKLRQAGTASMFAFGHGAGVIEGVLAGLQIPRRYVEPAVWKKRARLTGKDKDAARTLAIQTHPEIAGELIRKKDVGRADAVLIAEFGLAQPGIGDLL